MTTKTKLAKWGNSFAIRIPKVLIDGINIEKGEFLKVSANGNVITLSPNSNEDLLKRALEKTTSDQIQRLDDGGLMGKELWEYQP